MIPRPARIRHLLLLTALALPLQGCQQFGALSSIFEGQPVAAPPEPVAEPVMSAEKADLFRRAETERATDLAREIERLKADLRRAEEALIEAESGLAGTHTRADAVSSLAVAKIQVERAALRTPWRRTTIEDTRAKLAEAETQVAEGRYGAALFFVYRARRVAESLIDEAELVERSGDARFIHARRVNLRAGPSTDTPVLSVLEAGTPVFPRTQQGEWILLQVSGGPTGWVHQNLVGGRDLGRPPLPAAPTP